MPEVVHIADPGHGGIYPGATGGGLNEADLVMPFAWKVNWYLREYFGIKTDITRDAGEYKTLAQRVEKAEWYADRGYRVLFTPMHLNGDTDTQVRGHEVLWGKTDYNKGYATKLNNALISAFNELGYSTPNRGIKQRSGLYVIKHMPNNVIEGYLEPLFISNDRDRSVASDAASVDVIARHLSVAIAEEAGVAQIKAFGETKEPVFKIHLGNFRGEDELKEATDLLDSKKWYYTVEEIEE